MEERIIHNALIYPFAYPWVKKLNYKKNDIDEVLKKYELDTEDKRRKLSFILYNSVYLAAVDSINLKDVKMKAKINLEKYSYINNDLIFYAAKSIKLHNDENIDVFNKFIRNNIDEKEAIRRKNLITSWSIDLIAQCFGTKYEINAEDIRDISKSFIKSIFNDVYLNDNSILECIKCKGYEHIRNLSLIKDLDNSKILEYFNDFVGQSLKVYDISSLESKKYNLLLSKDESNYDLLVNPENIESNDEQREAMKELSELFAIGNDDGFVENEVLDSICSLFEEVKEDQIYEVINAVDCDTRDKKINEDISPKVKGLDAIKEDSAINNHSVESLKEDDFITISKEKYYKLMNNNNDKSIDIFKELMNYKNGAILGQLFNAYNDIDNISKDNLKAILTNFFLNLSLNGIDVIVRNEKIGENVAVNSNNILKEYILTEPVNIDGEIIGTIEHYGFSYKGKQIAPMIIKPV